MATEGAYTVDDDVIVIPTLVAAEEPPIKRSPVPGLATVDVASSSPIELMAPLK